MKQYIFGVDLGGTTVKLGLFRADGSLLDKWEIPTRTEDSGANILPDIARSMEEALERRGICRGGCFSVLRLGGGCTIINEKV